MVRFVPKTIVFAKSFVVRSSYQRTIPPAPATITLITMGGRSKAVPNTLPFPMITGFQSCNDFKSVYALSSECERYFSPFKSSRQERLWVRNGRTKIPLDDWKREFAGLTAQRDELLAESDILTAELRSAKTIKHNARKICRNPQLLCPYLPSRHPACRRCLSIQGSLSLPKIR